MKASNGLLASGDWSCSEVLLVQTQVVAGINYKITATFTNAANGQSENILFVVYVAPG
jgi:hypothetical protein